MRLDCRRKESAAFVLQKRMSAKPLLSEWQKRKPFREMVVRNGFLLECNSCGLISAVSEDSKQIEEEVDEVQIEAQGSYQCYLLCRLVSLFGVREHFFDLLCVVGCQSNEDQNASVAHNHGEHAAADENVDHGRDNDSDERHEQNLSPTGQVTLREVAVKGHGCECSCRDEEH